MISRIADITKLNMNNDTALHFAAKHIFSGTIEVLLKKIKEFPDKDLINTVYTLHF